MTEIIRPTYRGQTPSPADATRQAFQIAKTGRLPIVEIFYSLQGEGLRSGLATVFVRLAGCNCDCWFCDTDFRPREELFADEVLARADKLAPDCEWVCLTGGEPTIHALGPLCDAFHDAGWKIQVETNGVIPRPEWALDHITVSPKELQGAKINDWCYENATEFKYVVGSEADLDYALQSAKRHKRAAYLQPNALIPESFKLCSDAILTHPGDFRLSLQIHKIIGIQ